MTTGYGTPGMEIGGGRALREPALVASLPEPVPVSAHSGDDPARVCATCDSPDNLSEDFGRGGLNNVCRGCFFIWYDGPTQSYWDEKRRRMMTSGESMRRASLAAKVSGSWPYNGSQLPPPTDSERERAAAAIAMDARQGGDGEAGSVHDSAGPKDIAQTSEVNND